MTLRRKYIYCDFKMDVYDDESWEQSENLETDDNFRSALDKFRESFLKAQDTMKD